MTQSPVFADSLQSIAGDYDAFLLDLWGVIHDGQNLYPNVKECLRSMCAHNKKIVFLSNAPRRAAIAAQSLATMGIEEDMYDAIVTSGETAYQSLVDGVKGLSLAGRTYFYIGLEKDRNLLQRMDYTETRDIADADFVLLTHSYFDNQPETELEGLFNQALEKQLPVLCANPDTEIVRLDGERVYCAGALAEKYEAQGGRVLYFGKPHAKIYEACFSLLHGIGKSRILAVGDNMATDIRGAKQAGIHSALITSGVLREKVGNAGTDSYRQKCQQIFTAEHRSPTYVLPAFNW